jgi:hypothetical protein
MSSFEILDYIGVALFAATGALSASRKELDIIGFIFSCFRSRHWWGHCHICQQSKSKLYRWRALGI